MDLSKILDNIYNDRFLLVDLLNIFYHRSTAIVFGTVLFDSFLRLWKLFCFLKKIFSKSSYIYGFFYPKTSNFDNSGMAGRGNLSDTSMNNIFNVLLIGLQYTLWFKQLDFGLKCLVTITSKGQSLKFKASI